MQDPKKSPKIAIWAPSHNFVGLYLSNYGTYRQSEKKLLSINISSACPHNMVNFGPLAAEIVSLVWGTPGNFNGFRVLAALLHDTLVVGVSQTAVFNRGHHLYSAGRPSRWALAHIFSTLYTSCILSAYYAFPQSCGEASFFDNCIIESILVCVLNKW